MTELTPKVFSKGIGTASNSHAKKCKMQWSSYMLLNILSKRERCRQSIPDGYMKPWGPERPRSGAGWPYWLSEMGGGGIRQRKVCTVQENPEILNPSRRRNWQLVSAFTGILFAYIHILDPLYNTSDVKQKGCLHDRYKRYRHPCKPSCLSPGASWRLDAHYLS